MKKREERERLNLEYKEMVSEVNSYWKGIHLTCLPIIHRISELSCKKDALFMGKIEQFVKMEKHFFKNEKTENKTN